MSIRGLTYPKVAEILGVRYCGEPYPSDFCSTVNVDHDSGAWVDGMIHWRTRRMRHAGLRRFLFVIAKERARGLQSWHFRWIAARNIDAMADQLHVEFPVRMSDADRAYVKAALVRVPSSPLRDEAMTWASLVRVPTNQKVFAAELRFQIDHVREYSDEQTLAAHKSWAIRRMKEYIEKYPLFAASYQTKDRLGKERLEWLDENLGLSLSVPSAAKHSSPRRD